MKTISSPWKDTFLDLVATSKHSIQITSPFVKDNICRELLSVKQKEAKIELITSFKLMSIYSGSLDVSGLERILNHNGVVKNYSKLHSKIFLFDGERAVITSANLTNGGLTDNFEYGIYTAGIDIVSQISKDYNLLTQSKDIGTIKLQNISAAKAIIEKIPASKAPILPKLDLNSPEEQNEIIEIPSDILHSSLNGWILEVFKCVSSIHSQTFTLEDMNKFIPQLRNKYPNNKHIPAKIRQQLQELRDLGLINFLGNGRYKKLWK